MPRGANRSGASIPLDEGTTEPLYGSVIRLDQAADALVSARLTVLNKAMEDAVK
jgi:hypothetical protein